MLFPQLIHWSARLVTSGAANPQQSEKIRAGEAPHRFPQSEVKAPELFVPMVWTAVVLLPGQ